MYGTVELLCRILNTQ